MRPPLTQKTSTTPHYRQQFGALTDTNTNILLTVTPNSAALVFLQECTPGIKHSAAVNFPAYPDPFFLESVPPEEYPEWSFGRDKLFKKTPPDMLTEEIRQRSRLLTAKVKFLRDLMISLSRAREKVSTGIASQAAVYILKRMQAQRFKDSGYDEKMIIEIPFVVHYADFANLSLKQAADDILFKAKLDDDLLSKTETLRLKYFRQIRDVTDPEEIPEIMRRFRVDCFSPQIT